jgi:DNA-binding response OmpR family regulator
VPRVLVVDGCAESREVLRTLLERRGLIALEAIRPEQGLAMTQRERPDLIVLDADSDQSSSGENFGDLCEAAGRNRTPIVILGTLHEQRKGLRAEQFVPKPYHYGALIRKIDDLLAAA